MPFPELLPGQGTPTYLLSKVPQSLALKDYAETREIVNARGRAGTEVNMLAVAEDIMNQILDVWPRFRDSSRGFFIFLCPAKKQCGSNFATAVAFLPEKLQLPSFDFVKNLILEHSKSPN